MIVQNSKGQGEDMELLVLDLFTIARATSDFSPKNKLGEGGFGPVCWVNLQPVRSISYKDVLCYSKFSNHFANVNFQGVLVDGQEVVVKSFQESPNRD